jgi:hypothetical protein
MVRAETRLTPQQELGYCRKQWYWDNLSQQKARDQAPCETIMKQADGSVLTFGMLRNLEQQTDSG